MARLPYVVPFDPGFLGDGYRVNPPVPSCRGSLHDTGRFIDYIHFSLVLHKDRKTALYTAQNIDVSKKKSVPRTGWDLDPRVDFQSQTGPAAYSNNDWDRGHLVHRDSVVWGDTVQRARDASDSTFYYTNAAPQHARFNQDEWLKLEDWVLQKAGGASSKLCVFTGPIYTTVDKVDPVRIPSAFFKIVVLRDPTAGGSDLSALGFVMKQNELWDDWNGAAMLDLHAYQVGIGDIGLYTGLSFGEIAMLDEFEWRQARFRDRSRMLPVPIRGPEDIRFFGDVRRARTGLRSLRVSPPESAAESTAAESHDCGCRGASEPGADMAELSRQVRALRDAVDTLLEEQPATSGERRALRAAAERIVGGQLTDPNEFPHCACIGDADGYFCSGVLIHPRVVVTAAHCAPDISRVYLGGRSVTLASTQGEIRAVDRVIVHPDYHPQRVPSHDIAVLVLKDAATVAPVDLATLAEIDAEGSTMLVGFGFDHPTLNVGFGTRRKVDVPLSNLAGMSAPDIASFEQLHGFDNAHEFHAGRKMLGKDSCNGDSGGPAYVEIGGAFKLAGVTSRAAFSADIRCGDGGIYTRITPYRAWIASSTGLLDAQPDAPPAPEPTCGGLYVSAAMPNPLGQDPGAEWIEVTNSGADAVSLDGHSLSDKAGGEQALSGPIGPGATRRIVLPPASPVQLGNGGDDILLKKGAQVLHKVSYTAAGAGQVVTFAVPEFDGCGEPKFKADPC